MQFSKLPHRAQKKDAGPKILINVLGQVLGKRQLLRKKTFFSREKKTFHSPSIELICSERTSDPSSG